MKTIVPFICCLILISCSNTMSKTYKEEAFLLDMVEIRKSEGEDVAKTLTSYVTGQALRNAFNKENSVTLEGLTYKEIYESALNYEAEIKAKEAEEKILAEEEKRKRDELSVKIAESVVFALTKKGYSEDEYGIRKYLTYRFTFKNKTNRQIDGIRGVVSFYDIFDEEIKSLRLSYDDGIKPNSTATYNAQTEYNSFNDEDNKLKSTSFDKLKVVWEPSQLIFSDGENISLD